MVNFTAQDILGTLTVLPAFVPVLLAPGYLLGTAGNLLHFRERRFLDRFLLAIVLSCGVSPYAISTLARVFTIGQISSIFGLLCLIFLCRLAVEWQRAGRPVFARAHWTTTTAISLAAVWILLALGLLVDLQFGNALYSTPAAFDHVFRSTFIGSILRHGVPPANPFFYPAHSVPLRYYYYWNALCAVPAYTANASPRIALFGSCIWSALCVAALIPIYLKDFLDLKTNLRLASLLGIALLGITGLDILPNLGIAALRVIPPYADMEWWDPDQITSWLDSFLWVPHHIAALVACLTGFLLLWKACAARQMRSQALLLLIASISFASGAGLSVYVMLTFAIFLALWVGYLVGQRRPREALLFCLSGAISALISLSYLADLRAHGSTLPGSSSFVRLSLRHLPPIFEPFADLIGGTNPFWNGIGSIPFIVLTLFLEFGVFFAVGILQFKRDRSQSGRLTEQQRSLWIMTAACLLVMIFLRSSVIANNDLGWRAALPLQFALLLWTSASLANVIVPATEQSEPPPISPIRWSKALFALLILGAASSIYQLVMLRSFTVFSEHHHWKNDMLLAPGHEAMQIREAYARIDQIAPADTVVLYNPSSQWANQLLSYSKYQQSVAFAPGCGTAYGGSLPECEEVIKRIKQIFSPSSSGAGLSATEVAQICNSLHIDLLIVTANDPIWTNTNSWTGQQNPVIQNDSVRVYKPSSWQKLTAAGK